MATFWRRRGRPPHPEILTPSEQRVLELIREGKTNAEIAHELSISVPGVKWHVSNMLGKLGVADRRQLAAWDGRVTAAAVRASGKRAGTAGLAGWLGWKAAVGAGAGLAVAGIVVAVALSRPSTESPSAVVATPAPPQPPTALAATVDYADALSTKLTVRLQLASPPTDDYMLSIENGFAIYADGDRNRDYVQTMRLLESGLPNSGNGGIFSIEFDPVPVGTQFIEVVFNGKLRKVAMSQAESDRQKTPGAELFQALPPGTTARAAVVRDPVEMDLTDRAPKEFDSGLGWKYVFERVVATSTRLGVTYRVEGLTSRPGSFSAGRVSVDGQLLPRPDAETTIVDLPTNRDIARFAVGPGSRWVDDPMQATFRRQSAGGWTGWSGDTDVGRFSATFTDSPAVALEGPPDAVLFGAPTNLTDDLGHTYRQSGSYGGPALMDLKFEGPLDPAASVVTLDLEGYWVPESREWTVEIPIR